MAKQGGTEEVRGHFDDIFDEEGDFEDSRDHEHDATPTWARKKSGIRQKYEYHKERNLLEEDSEQTEGTSYVPPPNRIYGDGTGGGVGVEDDIEPTKSQLLANIFRPFARTLTYCGFFPYDIVEDEDAYYQVTYSRKSCQNILFMFGLCFYSFIYLVCFIGFLFVYNDWPVMLGTSPYIINGTNVFEQIVEKRWEEIMISNYWVMLLVFWFWMTMSLIGSLNILLHAKDYGYYHSYWHKTLTLLDIDPTDYIRQFLIKEAIFLGTMLLFMLLSFLIAASFRITCSLMGCFLLGMLVNDLPKQAWFPLIQVIGFLIVVYGYCGIRACLIQFVFYCRLLTNTVKIWNYRFESVLVGALFRDFLTTKMFAQYRILLKDHFLIVQLYKLTEGCFGSVLQLYYLLQTTCLVLMALYLYFNMAARRITVYTFKNYSYEKHDFYIPTYTQEEVPRYFGEEENIQTHQRAFHTIFYIFLFFQGIIMSFHVSAWAQTALDEGMDGFNVLRKHGLIMCTNRSERNLIHSLTISFARNNPLAITANGYFTVDKQLFLCIIAVMVNYVTMLIQFQFDEFLVSSVDFRLGWGKPSDSKTLLTHLPE